jgi:catechol 2,3-dioxygenase-like lactoylglutathione lyase family enzyme
MTHKTAPLTALLGSILLTHGGVTSAQLSAPNAAGVAMGHVHYAVRDIAANKAFWLALGGEPVSLLGTIEGVKFPDVVVLLRQAEPAGGSEGSVVNHVAFRVKSLAALETAGFDVHHNEEYPGVASVFSPEGERIELFDDGLATNLGFTIDGGADDATAERHNRKISVPIIAHHIHLYVPADQVSAAKEWYATTFGGVRGKRWRYDAVDLPGINLNFSSTQAALAPTRGRMLDHIGFEIQNLEAFCKQLEADGVKFDRPYAKLPSGFGLAFLTDPWGTYIELTEGLRDL